MQESEIFDVVDADDQIIGQATREEVHRRGLRHRSAHILVYDPNGRVYLQQRALWKDCSPGLWDTSAAGHLASGETYAEGAARELAEELGIRPASLEPLFKLPASPATGNEFVMAFRTLTSATIRPDSHEIIAGQWCTEAEITAWIQRAPETLTGAFRLLWAQLDAVP
jgi:isopentenyl-diphosphate Delta-isomerase